MSQESFHVGGRPTEHPEAREAEPPPELLDELLGGPVTEPDPEPGGEAASDPAGRSGDR